MEGIKELMEKMESDAAFRETIQSAADKDELMDKIKAAGFDTTFEEFSKAVAAQNGELSDDELEGAAGGRFGIPSIPSGMPDPREVVRKVEKAKEEERRSHTEVAPGSVMRELYKNS